MTSSEFRAERERQGLSVPEMAAEFGLTIATVGAIEAGRIPVPADVAAHLDWEKAASEREVVLAASGLPDCAIVAEIEKKLEGKEGDPLLAVVTELNRHCERCDLCLARAAYADEHGPPLPELYEPRWMRLIAWMGSLVDHLPPVVRPPAGPEGEHRRQALFVATAITLFAVGRLALEAVLMLVLDRWQASVWSGVWKMTLVIPGYYVGFYLAGLVFDATRPIKHRFAGYLIRGGLGAMVVYGTLGAIIPLLDEERSWSAYPVFLLVFAVIGGFAGALVWLNHRVRGKIERGEPRRVAGPQPDRS